MFDNGSDEDFGREVWIYLAECGFCNGKGGTCTICRGNGVMTCDEDDADFTVTMIDDEESEN